jgi:hypothetical protein
MAEACASCGRADLLQPDIANLQCLACGALTSIATGQVVVPQTPGPNLSQAGYPVTELSTGVVEAPASEYVSNRDALANPTVAPEAPVVPVEPVVDPAPIDAPIDPASMVVNLAPGTPIPAPIDLATLTPEQVAQIEAIAHPGG